MYTGTIDRYTADRNKNNRFDLLYVCTLRWSFLSLQGVEEALLLMKVGDKWLLTCPPALAFGNKGRPPSPGRPR